MDLLNLNSTIKENFKLKLNKENFKLFFCYKCNNLLKRKIKSDATCKFDNKNVQIIPYFIVEDVK